MELMVMDQTLGLITLLLLIHAYSQLIHVCLCMNEGANEGTKCSQSSDCVFTLYSLVAHCNQTDMNYLGLHSTHFLSLSWQDAAANTTPYTI